MATQRYLVLTRPPEGTTEDEFNQWYEIHVREVLGFPGFVSAERFEVHFKRSISGETFPFTYGVLYEIEGAFDEVWPRLRAADEAGELHSPEWTTQIRSGGWHCIPLGDRVLAT
jgi:hypothetical protein